MNKDQIFNLVKKEISVLKLNINVHFQAGYVSGLLFSFFSQGLITVDEFDQFNDLLVEAVRNSEAQS